jgi:hypothetical protein
MTDAATTSPNEKRRPSRHDLKTAPDADQEEEMEFIKQSTDDGYGWTAPVDYPSQIYRAEGR